MFDCGSIDNASSLTDSSLEAAADPLASSEAPYEPIQSGRERADRDLMTYSSPPLLPLAVRVPERSSSVSQSTTDDDDHDDHDHDDDDDDHGNDKAKASSTKTTAKPSKPTSIVTPVVTATTAASTSTTTTTLASSVRHTLFASARDSSSNQSEGNRSDSIGASRAMSSPSSVTQLLTDEELVTKARRTRFFCFFVFNECDHFHGLCCLNFFVIFFSFGF